MQVKDSNRVTGQGRSTCPFYEEIDAILGTRAASTPLTLLESSSNADDTDGEGMVELISTLKCSLLINA